MMKNLSIILSVFLLFQCKIDQTIVQVSDKEKDLLNDFQQMKEEHRLPITGENEPGEKLLLCLTFVNKEGKKNLSGQKVSFYHTSGSGEYEPEDPNDESTARLNGSAVTDPAGRIYVETILPGDYGRSENNRHIHMSAIGAKPEAYDIHFLQYTGRMGRNFVKRSDQHFLADLKLTEESILVAFLTIEVKNPVF